MPSSSATSSRWAQYLEGAAETKDERERRAETRGRALMRLHASAEDVASEGSLATLLQQAAAGRSTAAAASAEPPSLTPGDLAAWEALCTPDDAGTPHLSGESFPKLCEALGAAPESLNMMALVFECGSASTRSVSWSGLVERMVALGCASPAELQSHLERIAAGVCESSREEFHSWAFEASVGLLGAQEARRAGPRIPVDTAPLARKEVCQIARQQVGVAAEVAHELCGDLGVECACAASELSSRWSIAGQRTRCATRSRLHRAVPATRASYAASSEAPPGYRGGDIQ